MKDTEYLLQLAVILTFSWQIWWIFHSANSSLMLEIFYEDVDQCIIIFLHPRNWCLYTIILLFRILFGAWNSNVTVEGYGHFKTQKTYFGTLVKNMIIIFCFRVILITIGHYLVVIYSLVQYLMILFWYILDKQSNYWHFLLLYWSWFSGFNISLYIFFMMLLWVFFL